MEKIAIIGICVVIIGLQAVGWIISGQIGWERGDSQAQWEAHFDHEANKKTMAQIGTCRWAELAAGCTWKH